MQFGKAERQAAIREAILNKRIESQEDLKKELADNGISISQATLSRDLQEMGVVKSRGNSSSYYNIPSGHYRVHEAGSSVLSIEVSGNMVVVKTLPGHASMLASVIDGRGLAEIAGSIAGDDTIFIVLRPGVSASQAQNVITASLPENR